MREELLKSYLKGPMYQVATVKQTKLFKFSKEYTKTSESRVSRSCNYV